LEIKRIKMNKEKYTGIESDDGPGPQKSVEGYIICLTGLNEEVINCQTNSNDLFVYYRPKKKIYMTVLEDMAI
jgi:hypothetical protein